MVVCNLGNFLKVQNNIVWITDALDIDGLSLIVNGRGKVDRLRTAYKLGRHAEAGKEHVQLVVCTAVQMRAGHDVVTRPGQACQGQILCGLARRGRKAGDATLESRNAFLKDIHGRLPIAVSATL